MKMYTIAIPQRNAEHFARWTFENSVRIILSFATEEFFSGGVITAYVSVPEEKEADFVAEFGKFKK